MIEKYMATINAVWTNIFPLHFVQLSNIQYLMTITHDNKHHNMKRAISVVDIDVPAQKRPRITTQDLDERFEEVGSCCCHLSLQVLVHLFGRRSDDHSAEPRFPTPGYKAEVFLQCPVRITIEKKIQSNLLYHGMPVHVDVVD